MTLHLPGHPPTANQLHRMDHISRWQSRQQWKGWTIIAAQESKLAGLRITPARIHATYTFTTRRERDYDNLVAGLKGVIDGLVAAQVIPDDSLEHLRGIDILEVVDRKASPGIELWVERVEERRAA